MSKPRTSQQSRRTRGRTVAPWVIAVTIMALAGAVALAVGGGKQGDAKATGAAPGATGERNAMGMPYLETPGVVTGSAAAAGVEVTGANFALGRVPLNVAVRPTWTLSNHGSEAVTIGKASTEILKGCCPGPFVLGKRTLEPGSSTTLSFELAMHPGMDGPHDILVHVPLSAGGSTETLTLGVTGDFRE